MLGENTDDRSVVVEHGVNGTLSIIQDNWKYIEPSNAPALNTEVNIELGNSVEPQLYNLADDPGEKNNLAPKNKKRVAQMAAVLQQLKTTVPLTR
jgi:arylsulfatase A